MTSRTNQLIRVKPKIDKNPENIASEFKQNRNPDLHIGMNINSANSGGVMVKCPNSDDFNTIKNDFGNKYVEDIKKLSPRVIIIGIAEEEKDSEIKNLLQNIMHHCAKIGENFEFKEVL